MARKMKGSAFLRFYIPVIEVLKGLDGSGRATEVRDLVIENLGIPEEEQAVELKSGASRVRNQIDWARLYLAKSGYVTSSQRGVWSLTEKGMTANLSQEDVLKEFKKVQSGNKSKDSSSDEEISHDIEDSTSDSESEAVPSDGSKDISDILEVLLSLSPNGFERLCQRLLRESGFEQVVVTGKSNDGGIDGHGILQINPLVSFNVLFQCKRYRKTVSSPVVRDFRGAMTGRADKGIILTTGSFTAEARKEARRDGAPPIELVDGEKLMKMFENLELGLIPETTYRIDEDFFRSFK